MKKKLVLLDRLPDSREHLGVLLFDAGFFPLLCKSIEESLQRIQNGVPRFLWNISPEERNEEIVAVLKRIKEDSRTSGTFVIAMLEREGREEIRREAGGCVTKPISDAEFIENVIVQMGGREKDSQGEQERAGEERAAEEEVHDVFVRDEILDEAGNGGSGTGGKRCAERALEEGDWEGLAVLKRMVEKRRIALEPLPDPQSPSGYSYEILGEVCQVRAEEALLAGLVERGCLTRKLKDRVTLCPRCNSYNINHREVCPLCESLEIKQAEWIRHFSCKFIGPEFLFRSGTERKCPRCNGLLTREGVDFVPFQKGYTCAECGRSFPHPRKEGLCFRCGEVSQESAFVRKPLFSYQITDLGLRAARTDNLPEGVQAWDLVDRELGIYSHAFFQEVLNLEYQRARRNRNPFALLLVTVNGLQDHFSRSGEEGGRKVLKKVSSFLRSLLRISDVLSRYELSSFLALLPETSIEEGRIVVQRIFDASRRIKAGEVKEFPSLSLGLASFPASGRTLKELHSALAEGRRRALWGKEEIFFMGGRDSRNGFFEVAPIPLSEIHQGDREAAPSRSVWKRWVLGVLIILSFAGAGLVVWWKWKEILEILSKLFPS